MAPTAFLREAAWLNARRATAWVRVLAAALAVLAVVWVLRARGGVDVGGAPLGSDFLSFWTAGRLALQTGAAAAYDNAAHAALQQAAFPGAEPGYAPFPYPPTFLLACAPLALLPYFPALIAWLAATGVAYWLAVRAWIGERGFTLAILAFPAVAVNVAHGQSGFLSAALLGGGAFHLQRRPWLAGVLLGLLSFKPHLGLLVPVALVAARNWKAFLGAAASALALAGLATAVFGLEPWRAFLEQAPLMQTLVERGFLEPAKLITTFAGLRLLGAPLAAAYAGQALAALVAAAALAAFAWRHPRSPALGPLLAAAVLLPSPYLLDYDLTLAAIPLAWLLAEGCRSGFLPWEKLTMLAAYALPLFGRGIQMHAPVPVAPLVLIALFALVARRAWRSG